MSALLKRFALPVAILVLLVVNALVWQTMDRWKSSELANASAIADEQGALKEAELSLQPVFVPEFHDDDHDEFIGRPLFSSTRRPPLTVEATQPALEIQQPEELRGVFLSSIILTPEVRQVWIASAASQDTTRLTVGDTFQGWRLTSVEADHAVLVSGTRTKRFEFPDPRAAAERRPRRPQPQQGSPRGRSAAERRALP